VKTNTLIDQPKLEGKLPPGTGTLLAPLFTWRGRDVYPVFGAEGEGEGVDDPDSDSDDDNDAGTGEGAESKGADTVSREEFETLRRQLSASDKNKSAAEKKLEDAKKDEFTKTTERVAELEKTNAQQAKDLADMRLQNAFLTAETGITWHDPADALDVAERRGYLAEVVDEEGKVNTAKLTAKLKELAKAKPHLVKDGSESKEKDKPAGPTGSKVGGGNKKASDGPDLSRYGRLLNR
jgi:hypothetical protein